MNKELYWYLLAWKDRVRIYREAKKIGWKPKPVSITDLKCSKSFEEIMSMPKDHWPVGPEARI